MHRLVKLSSILTSTISIILLFVSSTANSEWVSADDNFTIEHSRSIFNRIFRTHLVNVDISNSSTATQLGPFRLVITYSNLTPSNSDGTTEDGLHYYDISNDRILPSESVEIDVNFTPEGRTRPRLTTRIELDDDLNCTAYHCSEDGVVFSQHDPAVYSSSSFDNTNEGWSLYREGLDYFPDDAGIYMLAKQENIWFSHMLYPYNAYSNLGNSLNQDSQIQIDTAYTSRQLDDREPLILIHGWQGDYLSNNLIGVTSIENMAENYFEEFFDFLDTNSEAAAGITDNYKIFIYKYPSYEHITYNGRMLGEAIYNNREIMNHLDGGGSLSILAHSMGGLVARSFIEEHGVGFAQTDNTDDSQVEPLVNYITVLPGDDVVNKLITLATPHHGSPAAVSPWIDNAADLAWIAGKDRSTPGALDLMWDNFDRAIDVMLISGTELEEAFSNDHYTQDGYNIFYWRDRGIGIGDKVDSFDKHYGELIDYSSWTETSHGQCVTTYDGEYICYEHPNPWLRNLNNNLVSTLPNSVDYYFYSGSSRSFFGSLPLESLNNGIGYEASHLAMTTDAYYGVNDGAVPSASALFDVNVFNSVSGWQKIWEIGYEYLYDNETNQVALPVRNNQELFQTSGTAIALSRYFHQYDHFMMKSGSGRYTPTGNTYVDRWLDSPNYGYLQSIVQDVGYPTENPDFSIPNDRLRYEPLFYQIAKDLEIPIGSNIQQSGLVAHYSFDNNLLDNTGFNENGVTSNGLTYASGISGQAATLNGIDQYIQLPRSDSILQTGTPREITVSLWAQIDNYEDNPVSIINEYDSGGYDNYFPFGLAINPNNNLYSAFRYTSGGHVGADNMLGSSYLFSDGQFHHLAVVFNQNDGTFKSYIDGLLVHTSTISTTADYTDNDPIYIGATRWQGVYQHFLDGAVDEVKIYNRALTDDEINQLCEEHGCPTTSVTLFDDFESNMNNWTLFGSPRPQLRSNIYGHSSVFDNMGDPSYASGAYSNTSVNLTQGGTIETDVYLDFSNPNGCWAGSTLALSRDENPVASNTLNPARAITFRYTSFGHACYATAANLRGHSYFIPHILAEDGTVDQADWSSLVADNYDNGWHTQRIVVRPDRYVEFYMDDDLIWMSTKRIDPEYLQGRRVILGDRSSGNAGKAYHDNVMVAQ